MARRYDNKNTRATKLEATLSAPRQESEIDMFDLMTFLDNELSNREVNEALYDEQVLSRGVMRRKRAAKARKKKKKLRERRRKKKNRRRHKTKTYTEPSAYYMDLKYNKLRSESGQCMSFAALDELLTSELKDVAYFIASTAIWFAQVGRCVRKKDNTGIALATAQFVGIVLKNSPGNTIQRLIQVVQDNEDFFDSNMETFEVVHDEEKAEVEPKFKSEAGALYYMQRVMRTSLFIAVKNIVLSAISLKMFSKDIAFKISGCIGKPVKTTLLELIATVIDSVAVLAKYARGFSEGKSFTEMWDAEDMFDGFISEATELLKYSARLTIGMRQDYCMDYVEYYTKLQDLMDSSEVVLKEISPMDERKFMITSLVDTLTNELVRMRNMLAGRERQKPTGIVLHGHPGVGKSNIMKEFYKRAMAVKGQEFDDSMVFAKNQSTLFWDGYRSQPIIHYAEVGNESLSMAQTTNNVMSELLQVLDTSPYCLNMSAVEDKGKYYCVPELVMIDTNNKFLHAEKLSISPAAVLRRFIFIGMVVKEEFADGVMIDKAKSLKAGGNILDRYIWTISVVKPKSKGFSEEILLTTGSVDEMFSFFENTLKKNYEIDAMVRDALSSEGMFPEDEKSYEPDLSVQEVCCDFEVNSESGMNVTLRTRVKERLAYYNVLMRSSTWFLTLTLLKFIVSRKLRYIGEPLFVEKHAWKRITCGFILYWLFIYFFPKTVAFLFYNVLVVICLIRPIPLLKLLSLNASPVAIEADRVKVSEKIAYLWNGTAYNYYKDNRWAKIAVKISAFAATGILLKSFYNYWKSTTLKSESSVFGMHSEYNDFINEVERDMQSDKSRSRVKTKEHAAWNTVHRNVKRPLHTGDIQQLYDSVSSGVYLACVKNEFGNEIPTHIFGISGSFAIVNRHAMAGAENATICIYRSGELSNVFAPVEIAVTPQTSFRFSDDLIMFHTRNKMQFKDYSRHVIDGDMVDNCSGMFDGAPTPIQQYRSITVLDEQLGSFKVENVYKYRRPFRPAMCGMPVLAKVGNAGVAIVAIHIAGDKNTDVRLGEAINKKQIVDAMNQISSRMPYMSLNSESGWDFEVRMPSGKSPFTYEQFDIVRYFGCHPDPVMLNNKSSLLQTKLSPHLTDLFRDKLDFERDEYYSRPPMKPFMRDGQYVSMWNIALRKINKDPPCLDVNILEKCVSAFTTRIVTMLESRGYGRNSMKPLDMEVAINGDKNDAFLRRINPATSGGFGYSGGKKKHIPIYDDEKREATSELKERIAQVFEVYRDRETVGFIYKCQLKDEPRLVEKCIAGKTRVFYMTSLDNLIVSRMMLAPLYTAMVEHGDVFYSAVGTNMHTQADAFFHRLVDFSQLLMEGDYSGYDVSNPVEISSAACQVTLNVLEYFGYNEEALAMTRGVLSDILCPNVLMNGDLFVKAGMQPSGKYGTAEDNSLRGVIMLMYAWYATPELEDLDFFEYVVASTYGDDMVAAVHPSVADFYNNHTYQKSCMDHYGMLFTSASKGMELQRFVDPSHVSFLRRTFCYRDVNEGYVAKLNRNSLYKALQWYIPSKVDSPIDQMVSTIRSVLWETYFHTSDAEFTSFREALISLMNKEYSEFEMDYYALFPTYVEIHARINDDELNARFFDEEESKDEDIPIRVESESCSARLCTFVPISNNRKKTTSKRLTVFVDSWCSNQWQTESNDMIGFDVLPNNENVNMMIAKLEAVEEKLDFDCEYYRLNPSEWTATTRERLRVASAQEDVAATIDYLRRLSKKNTKVIFNAESGFDMSTGTIDEIKVDEHGNVVLAQGEQTMITGDEQAFLMNNGQMTELSLSAFFERPVEIANFDVAIAGTVSSVYDVWDLFTMEPSVRAKLRNYAYIRGDLHVQISVSGSPFHYGRLLCSYQPYAARNETLIEYASLGAAYRPMLMNYLTQSKECVIMDIKANKPCELICPFISTKPAHRLYNSATTVISDVTSYEDLAEAGSLYVYTLNAPGAVSATASPISVQIYAWMTDIQLGCTTATQIAITSESGADERKVGPIEKYASNAKQVSDALQKVPFLEPFAKASSYVFGGVKGLASVFGWSKPIIDERVQYVKNRPFSNGAVCIGEDTAKMLTFDPHQELTVDPSVVALNHDDMLLKEMFTRETYLTTFQWAPTDTKMASPIFKCRVQPQLDTINEGVTLDFYQPTALSFASTPFAYWRGKVKFRFDFVASAYHRGKVALYYEPNIAQEAIIDADIDLNKNYMQIIDLQDTQSVEICVDWASPRSWLHTFDSANSILNYGEHFSATSNSYLYCNGYIGVTVFTDLQSPDDSTIDVNVFVSGEDMHYNQMIPDHLPSSRVTSESGSDLADQDVTCKILNETGAETHWISHYHFGEEPVSVRSLLKRYQYSQDISTSAGIATDVSLRASMLIYPLIQPTYGSSVASARKNLYSYLRYAYVGMRGSMKKRLHVASNWSFDSDLANVGITLGSVGTTGASSLNWVGDPVFPSMRGTVSFVPATNGGLEFSLPYYSNNLFCFSFADDLVGTNDVNDMDSQWTRAYQADFECDDPTSGAPHVVESQAIGEDFSFLRFQGAPMFSSSPVV